MASGWLCITDFSPGLMLESPRNQSFSPNLLPSKLHGLGSDAVSSGSSYSSIRRDGQSKSASVSTFLIAVLQRAVVRKSQLPDLRALHPEPLEPFFKAIIRAQMTLTAGTKLGRYEVLAPLGAGGMGEVYRALDRRLGRDIALKTLPESFIKDPEHVARFEREAQVLAAFNHPNIAAIYGVEEWNGGFALAMELVEGPTLAERIAAEPLEIEEALHVAHDVAEALEAAHQKGIIHRDLKPANIKLTSDSKVKVLDFGLAKALAPQTLPHPLADSPTVSFGRTREGIIVGTVAYMSPEQARGKPLDKRSDIWSFGSVLYEALTAKKAFPGETATDTLAAIIKREPDWSSLPQNTPPTICALLRRCLQKDPKQRLHDIADARIEIEEALHAPIEPVSPAFNAPIPGRRWPLAALLIASVVLSALVTWIASRILSNRNMNLLRVTAVARLTHDPDFSESPTWSPDGKMLAFSSNRSGNYEIYVRRIDGGQEVNVTNDPGQDFQPDFSPDGNSIAFVSTRSSRTGMVKLFGARGSSSEIHILGGDVWVVPALGGQARLLARDGNFPAWHPSGSKLLYVSGLEDHRSLMEVSIFLLTSLNKSSPTTKPSIRPPIQMGRYACPRSFAICRLTTRRSALSRRKKCCFATSWKAGIATGRMSALGGKRFIPIFLPANTLFA
jgi:serine/threonine protein kinase